MSEGKDSPLLPVFQEAQAEHGEEEGGEGGVKESCGSCSCSPGGCGSKE
jgi:hypothetical protein